MRTSFRKVLRIETLMIVAFVALTVWLVKRVRRDTSLIAEMGSAIATARNEHRFPRVGDSFADLSYRVTNGRDTVRLATLVTRRQRLVYFASSTCPACAVLEAQLDSTEPAWRGRALRVIADRSSPESEWRLLRVVDSVPEVPLVPSAIALDERDVVVAAVVGSAPGSALVASLAAYDHRGLDTVLHTRVIAALRASAPVAGSASR